MSRLTFASLLLGLAAGSAHAGVLRLAHDDTGTRLRVFDGATGSTAALDGTVLGVQVGSVSADTVGDRVFFVSQSGGEQVLHALHYGASAALERAALPPDLRVTHLEWDGSGIPRLVGIGVDAATDTTNLVQFRDGALTSLGMPLADCCSLRAGVSAFRASDDRLFVVGRVAGDTSDRLFRFDLGAVPAVASAPIDADLMVLELTVGADGEVFALAISETDERTRLVAIDAALNLTPRGDGVDDCCTIVTGSSTIDSLEASLVAIGSSIGASGPDRDRLWRFDLATGAIVEDATATPAVGLFHDVGAIVAGGELFTNGFEQGAPLPRPASASTR
jgi:hypothetical protein